MIELYHGSNVQIEQIDLHRSKLGKDFGCGFYLSPDKAQALKQANNTTNRERSGSPTITSFMLDDKIMESTELNIKIFEDYSEEWAEFILLNRRNHSRISIHNYDIVFGPIANDTVGVQLRRYIEGYIDIQQLVKELKFNKGITFQYFFGTERAIQKLTKL